MPVTTNLDALTLASLHEKICKLYISIEYNKAVLKVAKAYVQPLIENRCAWEHFGVAIKNQTLNPDLSVTEMKKAHEHMLRCYTEYSEFRFVMIKKYVERITKWTSKEAIKAMAEDFYNVVVPLLDTVDDRFNDVKAIPEGNLWERVAVLDEVNACCETILSKLNRRSLKMLRKKDRMSLLLGVFKYVGIAALSVLGTLLVQYLLHSP